MLPGYRIGKVVRVSESALERFLLEHQAGGFTISIKEPVEA